MKNFSIKSLNLILVLMIVFSFVFAFFIDSKSQAALSSSYTQYVKSGISAFPESYQKKLAYLKYLHPNWEFKAYYTGISWAEVTSSEAENACLRNTIYKNDLLDPAALCTCGRQGDSNYYCASAKTVNYYLDPRNFLGEAMVFEFLDLSNGSGVTREIVNQATKGTYLNQHVDAIMEVANEAKINPLHIVATIFQEIGRSDNSRAISGTVPGYEGYYNFYNYGATDGSGAVERGLAKAKELGWNNKTYALKDGAKRVLANGYISSGQTTKYFYKFDVVGNEIVNESSGTKTFPKSQFYNHQYMTNLRDPASQAGSLYDIYADSQILDQKLTFIIPVYDNMPGATAPVPTTLQASSEYGLYCLNSMKKWGVTMRETPSTSGRSLGNIYKDTIALHMGYTGSWSKIKIYRATTYDSSNKRWNYTEQVGYVLSEYLTRVGSDVPDYRAQVDMTDGKGSTEDIKLDGNYAKMTPGVTLEILKKKYSTATVKKADGTVITNNSDFIGTDFKVAYNGKEYIVVKSGDVNGDGKVKASDYVLIRNYIMDPQKNVFTDIKKIAADVNKDGNVKASDYVLIRNYIMYGNKIEL